VPSHWGTQKEKHYLKQTTNKQTKTGSSDYSLPCCLAHKQKNNKGPFKIFFSNTWRKKCLIEVYQEQQIVDKSVEMGSQ
jgi:hypothetical protein